MDASRPCPRLDRSGFNATLLRSRGLQPPSHWSSSGQSNNAALVSLINQVRFGPGIIFVLTGLVLVAAATILAAFAIWKSGIMPKWSGVPLAIAFAVYIPQLQGDPFFQPIRVAIGLLIALGCTWMAWGMLKE